MISPQSLETIESWVSDFVHSDAIAEFDDELKSYAPSILSVLLENACECRQVEPGDVEEEDLRMSLFQNVAGLPIDEPLRQKVPGLCRAFLEALESQGRLADGRRLGLFVSALREPYLASASGEVKTITRAGAKIGRNDPCPCGSGKKYKKCCSSLGR